MSIPYTLNTSPRFGAVADAFQANFDTGQEAAAAFYVFQHGQPIIDLKGGWTDRAQTRPVDDETLFAVFSSGKAIAALIIALLAEDNRLGYNQNITTLWPEFAAHGKGDMTVAQLLSHQSGLAGITDPSWTQADWFDWDKTCHTLAEQEPLWAPGTQSGYHPVTYGFLAGEIARRTDMQGRHLGDILREDLCEPDNIDVWIGLPESEHERCADMIKPRAIADLGEMNAATRAAFTEPWSSPGRKGQKAWREAQLAGSNCHATAEGLATLMQAVGNGFINGVPVLSEDILAELHQSRITGPDLVLPYTLDIAAGLMRNNNGFYGPNPDSLGHSGWGGSCVFADPTTGISAAYVMSRQDNTLMGDKRPAALIEALYEAL